MTQENLELKENEIYNGFKVLSISPIPAYDSVGIYLKHEKTGLEIFHMVNDDKENLFAFGFKTPSFDSCGTAHILEHSVLCGSKNYPLKDPFIRLSNQSVKTFLNAMTFPDKTVYPASSLNETDYFNLMAVYGDAVFFPLLTKETFLQEAHRLEFDKNGKLQFQGVVFNEMKGDYSSLNNVITTYITESLFPDASYSKDSGGEPTCIPDLTYEKFKEFHKIYYHPSNCKLFLYGNISTKKQLDFINEKFLSNPEFAEKNELNFDIDKMTFSKSFDKPKYITKFGPIENSSKGTNVVLGWKSDETTNGLSGMELAFLFEVLLGHDGAPLYRAILESNLCEDINAISIDTSLRYLLVTLGARGVKKGKEKNFEKFVLSELEKMVKNGLTKDDIDTAIMSLDFSNREINRGHGPYSLVLMRRAYRSWMNGANPSQTISGNEVFEQIKEKIKTQPDYVKNLIKKYLLDNPNRVCLTVIPDKNFNKKTEKILDKKIKSICKSIPKAKRNAFFENIKEETKKLNEYQQMTDSSELCSLIPHLSSKDLDLKIENDTIKRSKILGVDLFENQENVNGIVYVDLCFPVDLLDPKDYKYLPFYSGALTNVSFAGMSWAESSCETSKYTGGLGASLFTSSVTPDLIDKAHAANLDNKEFIKCMYDYDSVLSRNWLFVRMKMLEEKTEDAIKMLFSLIKTVDFSDLDRLSDLLTEYKNDFTSSIIPMGHTYSASRASCKYSKSKCIDEIWNGLSQLFVLNSPEFTKENIKSLKETLERIHKVVVDSGFIVHVTAENSGLERAKKSLESEISSFPYHKESLKFPFICDDKEFYDLVDIQGETSDLEQFVVSSQVGYYAKGFKASPYGTSKAVYESMFAHWLSNTVLWEQLRTIGGCYGAFAMPDALESMFSVATYRDPNPHNSKGLFENIFKNIDNWELDEIEFERVKTGSYSKEIQPRSPSSKGFVQFIRYLYGITYELRYNKLSTLLNSSLSDVVSSGKEICQNAQDGKSVIIFTKTEENAGKIVDLDL